MGVEQYRRQQRSLYGARFKKRLLDEVVWFRSEKLPNFSEFYVDNDHMKQIDNNSDHLISGRRGTGKTHLLGAFHEMIQKRQNEISIFVSLTDIGYQSHETFRSQDTDIRNRRVARQVFNAFLHEFFDKFLNSISDKIKNFSSERKKKINDSLESLLSEITLGSPVSVKAVGVEIDENLSATERRRGIRGGLSTKLENIGVNMGVSAARSNESKEKKVDTTEVNHIYVTDPSRVRKLLVEVVDQCELSLIHILIDEWMELDKKSDAKIQENFAQLLKVTFFNVPNISVKIASIWSQTDIYQKEGMEASQGIQVGQDIYHTINLDSSFLTSEVEIINFVKKLLYKRLRRKVPDLQDFEISKDVIDDEFITELFDDRKNFKVFVTAGHGIPRELMRIFEKSFQRIRADFERYAINYELIIDVSRDVYTENNRDVVAPGSPTKEQWIRINDYMEKCDRRFFLVDFDAPKKSTAIRNLIDHELIHEVHAPVLPREIRGDHRVYMIDYGTFVDWKKASFAPTEEMLSEFIFPEIDTETTVLEDCKIDVIADGDVYQDCHSCKRPIERNNPVVVKHNLCPLCGDHATHPSAGDTA